MFSLFLAQDYNKQSIMDMKKHTVDRESDFQYKVVYNSAIGGGLYLSKKALEYLRERGLKIKADKLKKYGSYVDFPRHNKVLVECVETLGEAANGSEDGWYPEAKLQVATISGKYYYIDDHDGAGEEVIDIRKMIDASK